MDDVLRYVGANGCNCEESVWGKISMYMRDVDYDTHCGLMIAKGWGNPASSVQ